MAKSDASGLRELFADFLELPIPHVIEFLGQLIADSTPFATNAAAFGQCVVYQVLQNFTQNVLLFQKGKKSDRSI